MKKKLLACLSALLLCSLSTKADDIVGIYNGELSVSLTEDNIPNTEIILSKDNGEDTYSLSIQDFNFMGMPIGDLTVGGITRTNEGNMVSLSKAGFSAGPTVEIAGTSVESYILLTHSVIDNGEFELELDIKTEDQDQATHITFVTFLGNKRSSYLFNPKNDSFAIRISSDFKTISTTEQSGSYIIFSTTGASVQSGEIENGNITVASLKAGIYIVKTNKGIAKFIKK